jgi:hypothetical protein
MNAALEEERRERLTIMAARPQAQEAMKLQQLVGEGKTDAVVGAASSSSVTSQALCPPMLPRSPATPRAATPVPPLGHAPSRFGDARSSSPELSLMTDGRQGEAIAVREEKKRREKEATANAFYDLTKKAIEVEESMAKAKAIEDEAKLMAEEREIMLVDTTNMTEAQKAWVEKRRAIILQRDE